MIYIDDFRSLVDQVAPHMASYSGQSVLSGIHVEATSDGLFLVATDRFTLAVARYPDDTSQNWTGHLPAPYVAAYRAMADDADDRDAVLDRTDTSLRLELGCGPGSLALPAPTRGSGKFPDWRKLLRTTLAAAPGLTEPVGLNPQFLARWQHTDALTGPLVVWQPGVGKPLVVARGDHFIGLHAPTTLDHARHGHSPAGTVRTAWDQALRAAAPRTSNASADTRRPTDAESVPGSV